MERTIWNFGDFAPEIDGVYERSYGEHKRYFCKFSEGRWYMPKESIKEAAAETRRSSCDDRPWREVTKDAS